ncbi:MAG: glycosyltransferase [Gallionellaceae bacterium]
MHKYIVVVSPSYGGAEKRFFDIFTTLRSRGENVILIAPSSLASRLKIDHHDRHDVLDAIVSVDLKVWSALEFVRGFRKLLQTLPHGGSFHYPLNCLWPLHLGRGDRVSMSVVDCASVPGPFAGKRASVWTWLSFFFVSRVDVLSPAIFMAMRGYRMASRMSLTPGGTYLVPPPESAPTKRPIVVFLGRLVALKGIDDFLDVVQEVWVRLCGRVPVDVSFEIAGYGLLENQVVKRVAALKRMGVPITFVGYVAAEPLLSRAAVLLSMQEVTNFPSRVVAEAMLAGCGVIVRDTGDSREFGVDIPGLTYCQAKLDPQEIADQLAVLLNSVIRDAGFPRKVRHAALVKFSSNHYIDYFNEIIFDQAQ